MKFNNSFKSKRIGFAFVVYSFTSLLFQGCSSTEIFVRSSRGYVQDRQPQPPRFSNLWEALRNLDFRDSVNLNADQKKFTEALQAFVKREVERSEQQFRDLLVRSSDTLVRNYSKVMLGEILFSQSKWDSILELNRRLPPDLSLKSSLAEAFSGQAPERYRLGTQADTLTIEIDSYGQILIHVLINGIPKKFGFDTGASVTALSSEVAAEAGIKALGSKSESAQTSTVTSLQFAPCVIGQMQIGNTTIENQPAAIIDQAYLSKKILGLITTYKLDGILGWHVIKELVWTINCRSMKMIVSAPVRKETMRANLFWSGMPLIETTGADGTRLFFHLDTGANTSTVTQNVYQKIPELRTSKTLKKVWGVGGSKLLFTDIVNTLPVILNGTVIIFRNIILQPQLEGKFLRYDGAFGIDLTKKGTIHIDYINGVFEFLPYDVN